MIKFPTKQNTKVLLQTLCVDGLNSKLKNRKIDVNEYIERLKYELNVVDQMGFNDYFLVVQDYVSEAKNRGILVGPGRGSAAGSLIAYSLGITEIDVTTNQACCVMNPSKDLEKKYLFYLLSAAKDYFIYSSYGAGQSNISQNTIKQLKIPYTCIQEQKRIADYLDSQCAKIDSIIEKQQAIIEKLIEYKLSVITEAVSIGIDGKKELRETGIPWIEAMPTEWKIARIKYNFYLKGRIGWQGLKANEFIDEGPFLVTGTDFIKGRVNWNTCYHISQERYDEAPEIHVKLGDLLITKDGTVGKVAYIDEKPEQVSLNSHLLIMRPTNNEYSNRFLFWVIQSGIFKKFFGLTQNGTIMASLSQEKITDFIYIMPRFEEQERISKYLEKEIARVDSNIEKKLLVIDKLNDYKKSLIYEVVTGKKEV